MPARWPAALLLVVAVACSSQDGRELPPAEAAPTTTSTAPPTIGTGDGGGVTEVFTLFSTGFVEGGPMPALHTCDGEDLSPPLDWVGAPPAAELALVARDVTAGGFVHWLVTGIDPTVQGFGTAGLPEGAEVGLNGFGERDWSGPCPPEGDGPHTYEIALHVLPEPLVLEGDEPAADAAAMVEAASTLRATLTTVYSR